MNRTAAALFFAIAVAVIGAVVWWQWPRRAAEPAPQATAAAPAAAGSTAAPAEPEIKYPIEAASAASAPFSNDVAVSLVELFGREAVLGYLQTDDFARRFVATVDNLGREQAPSRLWPVNPMAGRFTVSNDAIAPANAKRYEAFVRWVRGIDSARAAAWYVAQYPKFQKAYEDLGFPKKHFNDRLVDVIDRLLATPEPAGPLEVRLIEVKGPVKPVRPWVRYEYLDGSYEALTSGQKILLRLGSAHELELKAKLRELRAMITRP